MRQAEVSRRTKETQVKVVLTLDGEGQASINTGVGFLDHMLNHVARHALFDLRIEAKGDLYVDAHHTVEDIGICLGRALNEALKKPVEDERSNATVGLVRFGHAVIPMDEALAEVAVDFSGRPWLEFRADFARARVGEFDVELVEEFFRAFAMNSRSTLHIVLRYGGNVHHAVEAIFKAFARALGKAVLIDPCVKEVPSTKGLIET